MSQRIVVDPITRIERHLRSAVEVDGGTVRNSWSSGQMWRGIEVILQGRDPREAWLFTQRICGVCTTVHAIASVRAVENAIGLEIPLNAQYIRNLILAAHALHDHIGHFYHLSALDWVDVTSALKGDPAKTALLAETLSPWQGNSRREFEKVKNKLGDFVASGQLGIFTNGYWNHPAMHLSPEVNLLAVDPYFQENVSECIARAWYDGDWTRHPYEEETVPKYTDFQDDGKYSWVKAPRFDGHPMQVGPLAQMLVGYASGDQAIKNEVDSALAQASAIAHVKLTPAVLHSTLGRHLARALRAKLLAGLALKHWDLLAANIGKGDYTTFNKPEFPKGEQRGFGFHEAPRGTLSHWVVIKDGRIANYQAVVPSTWNAGPRDAKGQPGPYEASLLGNPVADAEHPLEVVRTIHSFDPCLACAVHTHDPQGHDVARVKAL